MKCCSGFWICSNSFVIPLVRVVWSCASAGGGMYCWHRYCYSFLVSISEYFKKNWNLHKHAVSCIPAVLYHFSYLLLSTSVSSQLYSFCRYSFPLHFFLCHSVLGCFCTLEIRRPGWTHVLLHQTPKYCEASSVPWWPAEPHKSHACTHKDRKKLIKKISVRDWLPCCLVKQSVH